MLEYEDKKEIIRLYNEGCNVEDIAEELGLDETEVLDFIDDVELGNINTETFNS